jgi:hypothetical protein
MPEARIARYRGMEYSEVTSSPLDILSNSNLGAAKAMFLNSMQRFLSEDVSLAPGLSWASASLLRRPRNQEVDGQEHSAGMTRH